MNSFLDALLGAVLFALFIGLLLFAPEWAPMLF